MTTLLFLLECSAVMFVAGNVAAFVLGALSPFLSRDFFMRRPALRADVALWLSVAPALVALGVTIAAALPSLLTIAGFEADHCGLHAHHLHLCGAHACLSRPALATVGAMGLMLFFGRALILVRRELRVRTSLARLESISVVEPGPPRVVSIPGPPVFCHATGIVRRRILLSQTLAALLSSRELRAAMAHECSHLDRRDPMSRLLFGIVGLFALSPFAGRLRRAFTEAAEESCDAFASQSVGDSVCVAEAMVRVASMGPTTRHAELFAFGEEHFERRVLILLSDSPPRHRRSYAWPTLFATSTCAVVSTFMAAPLIHHWVETVLAHVF